MPTPPTRRPAPIPAAEYRAQLAQANGRDASTSPAQPKAAKAKKPPSPTNKLTQAVISLLLLHGYEAWRQNNAAVYDPTRQVFRKGSAKRGISDILAYCRRTARFAVVEIKTGTDTLTPEQAAFLAGVRAAGGFACEGRDVAQVEAELKAYLAAPVSRPG